MKLEMKTILVADKRPELLATLEPILKHWGYRVLSTRNADQVATFLKESTPSMLVIGEDLLSSNELQLSKDIKRDITTGDFPCIGLRQGNELESDVCPQEILEVPLELFQLFSFIQRKVEKHPRQNLRLKVKFPGMFRLDGEGFMLADVLSLSIEGLFFKAAKKISKGQYLKVVFPLLGQRKEIEIGATVIYTVDPDVKNNFTQGFGVSFDTLPKDLKSDLKEFIRESFLKEVSSRQDGVGQFSKDQLKN